MEIKSEVINEDERYPLLVVKKNGVGKSENKHERMERMYYKEERNVIIPAHPKEDVNTSGKD